MNSKQNDGVFPYIHPYFCNFCSFYWQGVYITVLVFESACSNAGVLRGDALTSSKPGSLTNALVFVIGS